jgi:cation:H+ antiporter
LVTVLSLGSLIAGFALLVICGDRLIDASVALAQRWRIPESVIAATIIAGGTSAPEIVTSFMAALDGHFDVSLGNAIGSNTFNILAVGGLSLLLQPQARIKALWRPWLLLLVVSLFLYWALRDLTLYPKEALILLAILGLFFWISFKQRTSEPNLSPTQEPLWKSLLLVGICLTGVIIGAELALYGAIHIGKMAGLSDRVVAVTIISAGTGLPELVTSLVAAIKKHGDMALANIVGSNIINTLAIGGLTGSFFTLQVHPQLIKTDFTIMVLSSLCLGIVIFNQLPALRRLVGAAFLCAYLIYIVSLVTN